MSTQRKRFVRRLDRFNFTSDGIVRIALLIEKSLQKRGWLDIDLSKVSNIAPSTVGRYVKGVVKFPRVSVLEAIAPYIYKPTRFIKNDVELLDVCFDRWQDLAIVGTSSFTISEVSVENFSEMISKAMKFNGVSQTVLESILWRKLGAGASTITPDRLIEIQEGTGEPAAPHERGIISNIVDPDGKVYTNEKWMSPDNSHNPKHDLHSSNGANDHAKNNTNK